MSGRINQPNRVETWLLQEGEKPLTITEDAKLANAATIELKPADHTLGNMLRAQLLLDPTVLFAGYKLPHPLENIISLKIQTDERSNPADALKRACTLLIQQTVAVKQQFADQARNVQIMGADLGAGAGAAAGAGALGGGIGGGIAAGPQGQAYDPYADGLGQPGTQAGADVYDF
ncbi:DNA-directed RNA polymerase II core subunit [Cryptotrichosporon argae]